MTPPRQKAVNSFHFPIKVSIVSTVCSPINVLYPNVEGENFDSKISSTFIHIRLYVIVITNSKLL